MGASNTAFMEPFLRIYFRKSRLRSCLVSIQSLRVSYVKI